MPMTKEDFLDIARLHKESIPGGFLSSLGMTFLSRLYQGIARNPGSCVIVERGPDGKVAGFVCGALSVKKCYQQVLLRGFLSLGLPIALKLLRPAVIKRVWETLRYPGKKPENTASADAELLSIAVSDLARGQGVGKKLVCELEKWFVDKGYRDAYKVVTFAEDARSNGFYKKTGFRFNREFTHHGNRMNEYMKRVGD